MPILETKEIAMILQEETKPFLKTTAEMLEILEMRVHSGGVYGAKAGNNSFDGKGGHAVFSNTKSQVKLSTTSNNKGKTSNVTT